VPAIGRINNNVTVRAWRTSRETGYPKMFSTKRGRVNADREFDGKNGSPSFRVRSNIPGAEKSPGAADGNDFRAYSAPPLAHGQQTLTQLPVSNTVRRVRHFSRDVVNDGPRDFFVPVFRVSSVFLRIIRPLRVTTASPHLRTVGT